MKLLKRTFFAITAVLLITSCSSPDSSVELVVASDITASGPLFEGSNTFQAEVSNALNSFLNEKNIAADKVDNIMLLSCKVKSDDNDELAIVESINLQLSSENFPMQSVAVANPFTPNNGVVTLKVADEQESINEILNEETFYVVADGSVTEDYDYDMTLSCEMTFKINYYKN